jgi:uncharacterized protein (TIRG00374 family)
MIELKIKIKLLLKITVSALFLIYVFVHFDFGAIMSAMLSVNPSFFTASLAVMVLNSLMLALKYKSIMAPSGIHQPISDLFRINLICRFYSTFLTTAVGQGLIRWYISTKKQEGRYKFFAVMLADRFLFLLVLLLAISTAVSTLPNHDLPTNITSIIPYIHLMTALGLLFYLVLNLPVLYHALEKIRPAEQKGVTGNKPAKYVSLLINSLLIYQSQQKVLFTGLLLSILWQALFLFRIFLLIEAMDLSIDFGTISWMASMVLLLQVAPVTLNGLGIRETAYAVFFEMLNLPPEKGVILGILMFSQILFISLLGGVLLWIDRKKR